MDAALAAALADSDSDEGESHQSPALRLNLALQARIEAALKWLSEEGDHTKLEEFESTLKELEVEVMTLSLASHAQSPKVEAGSSYPSWLS